MGVVDVLPKCLSSKYFFWEPSFAWASLGKLGALREIEWVRDASRTCGSLRYYYLGYYIHACPKMRYKAEYRPSELKCAVTGRWTPLEDREVLRRLEGGAFAPLRAAPEADRNGSSAESDAADAAETKVRSGSDDCAVARAVPVGLAAGGQILQVAPFALVRKGPLGGPAGAALARRVATWRRATGDAGDAIVYLVDLEGVAAERPTGVSVADERASDAETLSANASSAEAEEEREASQ